MNKRPELKIGDIVKLSKRGRSFSRPFPTNSSMVVCGIEQNENSSDRMAIIKCKLKVNGETKVFNFYRAELWYTQKNIFELNR
jgi:hypothetical protein